VKEFEVGWKRGLLLLLLLLLVILEWMVECTVCVNHRPHKVWWLTPSHPAVKIPVLSCHYFENLN
jgi:hypothetical protein